MLIQGPGYKLLGIDQSGFAESVGIPLHQISYAVKYDNVDSASLEFIEQMLPIETIKEAYTPVNIDSIKFHPDFNTRFLESHKRAFMKLYFHMLPRHLPSFVESYLVSTSGFWKIMPTSRIGIIGAHYEENEMGIYSIDLLHKYFQIDLGDRLKSIASELSQTLPLFHIWLAVWLTFYYVVVAAWQKLYWKCLMVLPLLGCWFTYMVATPVWHQFRYMYPYHLMLPIVVVFLFFQGKQSAEYERKA